MTVAPVPGRVAAPGGGQPHSRSARWAVGLSVAFGVAVATSTTMAAIGYAVGGSDAIEDTTLAYLVSLVALAGVIAAVIAFALAIVVRIRHERWTLLWLPLSALPAFLAFVVLGETLWWE